MSIWEHEARDIAAYLERHGYTSRKGLDHVIVCDPVMVFSGGGRGRTTRYVDVVVHDWNAAIAFVEERG